MSRLVRTESYSEELILKAKTDLKGSTARHFLTEVLTIIEPDNYMYFFWKSLKPMPFQFSGSVEKKEMLKNKTI
jgi:hypothetical protein